MNSATINITRHFFKRNHYEFETNINGDFKLVNYRGFKLKSEDKYIYNDSFTPIRYKTREVRLNRKLLGCFPIELSIYSSNDIVILEPHGKGITTSIYPVKIKGKDFGEVVISANPFASKHSYTANFKDASKEDSNFMLFALMYLFMKTNENLGT